MKIKLIKKSQFVDNAATISPELDKELKFLAKRFSDDEIDFDSAVGKIMELTASQPREIRYSAIERFQNLVSLIFSSKSQFIAASNKKIIKTAQNNNVFDISINETLDLNSLSFQELKEVYETGDFDDSDYAKVEAELVSRQSSRDDYLYEVEKDRRLMQNTSSRDIIKTSQSEYERNMGEELRLNKDYDVKKHVKDEAGAALFLAASLLVDPSIFPKFIGLTEPEIVKVVDSNIQRVIQKYNLPALPQGLSVKSFDTVVMVMNSIMLALASNPRASVVMIDLLGLETGSNKLVKRLYDYVPLVIHGKEEVEGATKEMSKQEKQDIQDKAMDMYNSGKITKEELKEKMLEFAIFKQELIKIASQVFKQ